MALSQKQKIALELLTCGEGYTLQEIADLSKINVKTLYNWRNLPEYAEFQHELNRINNARWQAAEDAARQATIRLCQQNNQKMVQFVMQNLGYNPTQKIEADVNTDIVINIEE